MPLFSIIIPSYNRSKTLPGSIQSVIDQDFEDFELLIVDDGSTDNTRELIASITDPRVRYIYQDNAERSAARNNGIAQAEGEWICFLDSDDLFLSNHLSTLKTALETHPEFLFFVTRSWSEKDGVRAAHPNLDLAHNNIIIEIATKFILPIVTCTHKSVFRDHLYDIRFNIWEDTHLWLRIAAHYELFQIEVFTNVHILHPESSVEEFAKVVQLNKVNRYLSAIEDIRQNSSIQQKFPESTTFFKQYILNKYDMFIYQARQNKQIKTSTQLIINRLMIRFQWSAFMEFPKAVLNKFNIGIHV